MNKLDKFEQLIKKSLEGYEMPYDPSQWARFEQKLGAKPTPQANSGKWYIAAGAAALATLAATLYFAPIQNNDTSNNFNNHKINTYKNNTQTTLENKSGLNNAINNNSVTENNATSNSVKHNNHATANTTTNNDTYTQTAVNPQIKESNNHNTPAEEKNTPAGKHTSTLNNTNPPVITPVTNTQNPKHTEPVLIDIDKKPLISIDKTTACAGEKITIRVENTSVNLDLGNGETITLLANDKKQISFNEAGVYNIHATESPEITQTVTILAKPEANIIYNTTIEEARQITKFSTDIYQYSNLTWVFHDGKTSQEKNTWRYYNQKGTYPIKLILEGNNGCKNEINKQIIIENDYNLLAPNIFSPNGDGINETFIPEALKVLNVNFVMTVYDRSGKLVYTTNTVDKPWDGRYTSDNKLAPAGVYIWVVKMVDDKGNTETFKGDIRLD